MMSDSASNSEAEVIVNELINESQLAQLKKFAELGRLSANLIHDISNPLSAALIYLEDFDNQKSINIAELRSSIILLRSYVESARQQVRGESKPCRFLIRDQVLQLKQILIPLARTRQVKLWFKQSPNYSIFGDQVKFQQIIANLVVNSIDSYDGSSQPLDKKIVEVSFRNHQEWLIMDVLDYGKGLTNHQQSKMFEEFYTTKKLDGRGLGLGLSAVKAYIEKDFSGSIRLLRSDSNGTKFEAKIRLTPIYPK